MDREQLKHLASLAEANRKKFTAEVNHADLLREVIEEADVVWGVWNDPTAAYGVDVALIKGHDRLMLIAQSPRPVATKVAAVPCRNVEEAEAMRLEFGDDRARSSN
jgi:hypothetical protein